MRRNYFLLITGIALTILAGISLVTDTTSPNFHETIWYYKDVLPGYIVNGHMIYVYIVRNVTTIENSPTNYTTIQEVSAYLTGFNISKLQLNGTMFLGPIRIGNYFYFTYLSNVKALKAEAPKIPEVSKDYLAYVEFTGNEWGKVKNILTSGFISFLTICSDTIYALWRPTANSSASYLLTITPNGKVINNVSLHLINASYLIPVTNYIGIVVNSTPLITESYIMTFFYVWPFSNIQVTGNSYIVNLSSGNIIRNIPKYNNISSFIITSGNGLILVSYFTSNDTTYLVLYSSLGKIISEKTFEGLVSARINGSYIIVDNSSAIEHGCSQGVCVVAWEHELSIYSYNWTLLYSYYFNVSSGAVVENPIIANSSLEYTVSNYVTKVINQTLKEVIENISIEKVPIPLNVTSSSTTTTKTTTISSTLSKNTSTINATITTTSSSKTTPSTKNSKLIEITLIAIVIIVVIGAVAYLIKRRK